MQITDEFKTREALSGADVIVIDRVSLEKIESKLGETALAVGRMRTIAGVTFDLCETREEAIERWHNYTDSSVLLVVEPSPCEDCGRTSVGVEHMHSGLCQECLHGPLK